MSTTLQIAANQANSKLSTGPTSQPGKQAASRNAISHGLTSRNPLIPGEDPVEHELYTQAYLDRYEPCNQSIANSSSSSPVSAGAFVACLTWNRIYSVSRSLASLPIPGSVT